MKRIRQLFRIFVTCAMISSLFVSVGCQDTETRKKADKSVEKFAGKDKVDLMKKMEADVQESMKKEADRLKESE